MLKVLSFSNLLFQLFVSRIKEAYTNAKISRNNELKDTLILTTGDIGRYFYLYIIRCSLLDIFGLQIRDVSFTSIDGRNKTFKTQSCNQIHPR